MIISETVENIPNHVRLFFAQVPSLLRLRILLAPGRIVVSRTLLAIVCKSLVASCSASNFGSKRFHDGRIPLGFISKYSSFARFNLGWWKFCLICMLLQNGSVSKMAIEKKGYVVAHRINYLFFMS